jgi:hypothetical protein
LTVDLEPVFGNIDEYAQAVEATREVLGGGEGGKKASFVWKMIYQAAREGHGGVSKKTEDFVALYWEIIRSRAGAVEAGHAPWWYLLNYGNATGAMSSDVGGTPYPRNAPTNFLLRVETKLNVIFQRRAKENSDKLQELFTDQRFYRQLRNKINAAARGQVDTEEFESWDDAFKRIEIGSHDYVLYLLRGKGPYVRRL